jgi:alcohol dehydrogenase
MRAVVYRRIRELPQIAELPEPPCPSDGVVVAVRATGLCRSDWHAWMGHEPVPLPHVPVHEFAGVIDQVAPTSADGRSAIA